MLKKNELGVKIKLEKGIKWMNWVGKNLPVALPAAVARAHLDPLLLRP